MSGLKSVTPMLNVADIDEAIAFYTTWGFEVQGTDADLQEDGKIYWAMLSHGDAGIMLTAGGDRTPKQGQTNYLAVSDVDAFHDRIKDMVEITDPLADRHYGVRDAWFRDPFGFHWGAGQNLAP